MTKDTTCKQESLPESASTEQEKSSLVVDLVRHGQTFQNYRGIVQGQDPRLGRLTEEGLEQAKLLGKRLVSQDYAACYCSPLERAVLTLAMILTARSGEKTLPLVFPPALKEIKQGHLNGASHQQWQLEMVGQDPMQFRPQGGENWHDVQKRSYQWFQQQMPEWLSPVAKKILVIAHGGVNRGIISSLLGISMEQAWRGTSEETGTGCPQDNSCLNRLHFSQKGQLLKALINDTTHLIKPTTKQVGLNWTLKQGFHKTTCHSSNQEFKPFG